MGERHGWRLVLRAAAVGQHLRDLRVAVAHCARQHGVSDAGARDVELAVSEAMTNVVVHAYEDDDGEIRVLAGCFEDRFVVTVEDDGAGVAPRADSPGMGLGLPLMVRLASVCQISRGPDGRGTRVRLEFPLG